MTVLIIGGGVAGPVAAMALQRAGLDAVIYEARPPHEADTGGALSLAPNGLAALGVLGVEHAVAEAGLPIGRMVFADGRGRTLGEIPGLPGLPPQRAMWRGDLCRVLREQAQERGVRIEYGKRLAGAEQDADGITVRFTDGTTARGRVLIGADGVHSTVRSLIDPQAPGPRHVPLLNFGGMSRAETGARPGAMYFVYGRRGFLGYWALPGGGTAWFANVPHPEPVTIAQARRVPAEEWLRRLRALYAGDTPAAALLEGTPPADLSPFGTPHIMPAARRWHRGRMVVTGDAAHTPSPSSGQGASLAAESAVQLARCLRDLPDTASAFAAYERLRRRRVEKVAARAARTNGSKTLGPLSAAVMRLMMPLAMRTFLTPDRMLGAEHRHTIDWDAPVAA